MELNFSNKGLVSFDASYLGRRVESSINASILSGSNTTATAANDDEALSSLLERAPVVKGVNLSHNAIRFFLGGETLRHVSVLDLSYNALSVLNTNSLPPNLLRLNLSHNTLRELGGLARHAPTLQELDISHNSFSSSGLRELPTSLTTLYLQCNEVESLDELRSLKRLSTLSVPQNRLETIDSLEGLRSLRSLHHLELRGNAVVDVTATTFGVPWRTAISRVLADVAPKLISLDGMPLSQAPSNSKFKANQSLSSARASANTSQVVDQRSHMLSNTSSASSQVLASAATPRRLQGSGPPSFNRFTRSHSTDSRVTQNATTINSSTARARRARPTAVSTGPPMEVRLMEAKVAELQKLLSESEKQETQMRFERGVLIDQIKSCAGVIDNQAQELEALQAEIMELEKEEEALRKPVAAAEHTFEQTHATLLAQKVQLLSQGSSHRASSHSSAK